MGLLSIIWGVVALVLMCVAWLPLVGWLNWLVIPFAAVGAILAAIGIGLSRAPGNHRARTGFLLNGIVILGALVRLGMGGGIF